MVRKEEHSKEKYLLSIIFFVLIDRSGIFFVVFCSTIFLLREVFCSTRSQPNTIVFMCSN